MAMVSIGSIAMAQKTEEKDVPSVVKSEFASLYPSVKAEKWEREDGAYKACFKKDSRDMRVAISSTGTLIDTETKIESGDLPHNVIDYTNKNYSGKMIHKVCRVKDASGKETYVVKISDSKLTFDMDGNLLRSEKTTKKA